MGFRGFGDRGISKSLSYVTRVTRLYVNSATENKCGVEMCGMATSPSFRPNNIETTTKKDNEIFYWLRSYLLF